MQFLTDLAHWVLSWADTPWGALALFVLAFWESSFFPVPPDGLMIALAAGNLPFALGFSSIATAGSLLGAMLGYWIGLKGGRPILNRLFAEEKILFAERQYHKRDVWAVSIAGFTPIPYKIFAIGAGAFRLSFKRFMLASLLGRAGRFFLVGLLIIAFGEQIQAAIDQYLDWLALAFVVLLVLGFVAVRFLARRRAPASDVAAD